MAPLYMPPEYKPFWLQFVALCKSRNKKVSGEIRRLITAELWQAGIAPAPLHIQRIEEEPASDAVIAKFWSRVTKTEGCWVWIAGRSKSGYGMMNYRGMIQPTHRISYELAHGSIPKGKMVLHKCDNKPCVNPSHLYLGTASDNARDRERGRRERTRLGPIH
jgi:hypothetical protein